MEKQATTMVMVPMPVTLRQKLEKLADEDGRKLAPYIRRLIEVTYSEKYGLNNAEPIGKAAHDG